VGSSGMPARNPTAKPVVDEGLEKGPNLSNGSFVLHHALTFFTMSPIRITPGKATRALMPRK
jgi:hypothetical protein